LVEGVVVVAPAQPVGIAADTRADALLTGNGMKLCCASHARACTTCDGQMGDDEPAALSLLRMSCIPIASADSERHAGRIARTFGAAQTDRWVPLCLGDEPFQHMPQVSKSDGLVRIPSADAVRAR